VRSGLLQRFRGGGGGLAALAVLLAAGLGLRAFLAYSYAPAILHNPDSGRYLRSAFGANGVFSDPLAPAGYPLFLRAAGAVSDELWLTIALQHALGVGTALLLFACVRAAGAPRGVAAVPAAVVLLGADQLYLEHALLSEAPFAFLMAAGLLAGLHALRSPRALEWLAVSGALLGSAGLVRGVGVLLVPVVGVWAALVVRGAARRIAGAGAVVLGAAPVLAAYLLAVAAGGGVTGLTEQSGWALYARAAPFARCEAFTPPLGTERLCEARATDFRPGGSFYLWDRWESPGRRAFGFPPTGDDDVGAWARAAVAGQPLDYLGDVAGDLRRTVAPDAAPRRLLSGGGSGSIALDRRSPAFERDVGEAVREHYPPGEGEIGPGVKALAAYQRLTSPLLRSLPVVLGGLMLVALVLLPPGRGRAGAALLGAIGGVLLVAPVALFQYTPRFGIPPSGPLAAAAALGGWWLAERARRRGATALEARAGAVRDLAAR
jgi:hypothetical protein